MSTLYLIRHGQASFGAADYDALSPLGHRQARLLGNHFLNAGFRFDACWSGTLRRQRQTAETVAACCRSAGVEMPEPAQIQALNEYDYETVLRALIPLIEAEDPPFVQDVQKMLSDRRAFQQVFGRAMRRWASGQDALDSLPSWKTFCQRVSSGMETIMAGSQRGSHVAVFTSGGPIAAYAGAVLGLDPVTTISLSWQLVNASVTRFQFSRGRVSLATFNEQGHLEGPASENLITYR